MPTPAYLALQAIQQGPGVRRKLDEVADRIAARLVSITARDHLSRETNVVDRTSGTRPRGRSYSSVGLSHRSRAEGQAEIGQALGGVSVTNQVVSGSRNPRVRP